MRANTEYHVHVNSFGKVSASTHQALVESGFTYRDARIDPDRGVPQRMGIYTKRPKTPEGRDVAFEEAHALISSDPAFKGYVECESCTDHLTANMEFRPFASDSSIAEECHVPTLPMTADQRTADIHIYIPVGESSPEVERFLRSHHFYLVTTDSSKIYTLGMASMADAKPLYVLLRDYFQAHGGIRRIECEPVNRIEPAHQGFEFRTVAGRGVEDRPSLSKSPQR